jgi:hypothetical protein
MEKEITEKRLIQRIAAYCRDEGLCTDEGNYIFTYDDVIDAFAKNYGIALEKQWLIDHHKAIFDKIQSYVAVSDVLDDTDEKDVVDGWDVNFYLNYCPYFQRG